MANPTMEPIAVIRKQLEEAEPDLLRDLRQGVIEARMGAEVDALAGAACRERSERRTNRRNGYRSRRCDTRAGMIDLAILKLRQGSYFPAWLLEPRRGPNARRSAWSRRRTSRASRRVGSRIWSRRWG